MKGRPENVREFVLRAQRGDRAAFDELVELHASLLGALFFASAPGVQDHEDLAQETFTRAFEALPRLRKASSFASWLCAIGRNVARESLRRVRETVPLDAVAEPAFDPPAARPRIDREAFRECLERLPAGLQETFLLRHVQGLSYRNIAETIRKTVSNVSEKLSRARRLLRRCLEAKGVWG